MVRNIQEANTILATERDEELRELARQEVDSLSKKLEPLEEEIKLLLVPADPQDGKNAIVEIRGGTGGDEAAIFAGDLFKMYAKFCESKGWKTEVTSFTEGTMGGYKEIIFTVSGTNVYGVLKYESGVHRVQRVPATESQGRVHTSAATVAVLPEAEEFDIELKESDIRTDIFCASGHGGQSVNTTYSAIRLVHIPTKTKSRNSRIKPKHLSSFAPEYTIWNTKNISIASPQSVKRWFPPAIEVPKYVPTTTRKDVLPTIELIILYIIYLLLWVEIYKSVSINSLLPKTPKGSKKMSCKRTCFFT